LVAPKQINIDIMPAAAESAGSRKRVSLGVNTDHLVARDDLALDTIAVPTVTSAAHGTAASLVRCGLPGVAGSGT
jgi:hypothetical protein